MKEMNMYFDCIYGNHHKDHIIVGCPELCTKEIWDLRDVIFIVCATPIIVNILENSK